MPDFFEWIEKLFHQQNRPMAWGRIPPGHALGVAPQPAFKPNDDYVIVRLSSMFLCNSRELWLKLSPLVHATVAMAGRREPRNESAVIGPAQFGDLPMASAERSVVLNQRLSGPAVWRGGDLCIAAGLFAVPKDQAASALLGTLGQLSALGLPGLQQGLEVARIVKSGVESLIGLSGTRAMLGVKVALPEASAPEPCLLAGIAAPADEIDFDTLWVREGLLCTGPSARELAPLQAYDHVLLAVERGLPRQDWRGLASLTPHEARFAEVLRDATATEASSRERLNQVFAGFDSDLAAEDELSEPDKARIRSEVVAELVDRLRRKFNPLFGVPSETRSIGGLRRRHVAAAGFDFLDVGDLPLGAAPPVAPGTSPF